MQHGERFNGYSHLAGLLLALGGAAWLVHRAAATGDAGYLAGVWVFGLSSVLVYAASTLYHSASGAAKRVWLRLDHCAIFLLIAGSYTPFALAAPNDLWNWGLLVAVWAAAAWGVWQEAVRPAHEPPSLYSYLAVGWLSVAGACIAAVDANAQAVVWLLAGAFVYTAGTAVYRKLVGWTHGHGLWHLCVLAGNLCHYLSVRSLIT
jgi:hemolysin III